jgi:hypothetical protein
VGRRRAFGRRQEFQVVFAGQLAAHFGHGAIDPLQALALDGADAAGAATEPLWLGSAIQELRESPGHCVGTPPKRNRKDREKVLTNSIRFGIKVRRKVPSANIFCRGRSVTSDAFDVLFGILIDLP